MKTNKRLKIGSSDFRSIIRDNGYFVDKTLFIKEFIEHDSYIQIIPRPRRFGKTLNLSMIEYFFDIQKPESAALFHDFDISKEVEFCQQHQNQYPVINITLKEIREFNWKNCLESFKNTISNLFEKFDFLLQSDKLKTVEKEWFNEIIAGRASESKYKSSLKDLSYYLHKHFDNEVIILVDEYDAPIINAFRNTPSPIKNIKGEPTYYENVISFMQVFLGGAFKGNQSLKKGLITGVMRVGRESIFSEWNNFSVYGITSNYFADKFGFTQSETVKLLNYFGLQDHIADVEKWYDGYKFGNIDKIYNPWSIVNYVGNINDGFKPYWVNTSNDSLIKERITEPNVKEAILELINNQTIVRTIHENFVFPDFENDTELLWTLLFHSGFLTQVKEVSLYRYELRIPNFELKFVFKNIVLEWINNSYKLNKDLLINTANYLVNNNIEKFEIGFKKVIGDTLSYFDLPNEQLYHVYTLGLLAVLSDDYIIKSNRESGEGRYDIILIPYSTNNYGIVIEIKKIDGQREAETYETFSERINSEIDTALQQIERKKYYKELLSHKVNIEKIMRVPIVFAGKESFITKL